MNLRFFLSWFASGSRKQDSQWVAKTFVLEPILTPIALVDGEEDTPDPVLVELPDDGDDGEAVKLAAEMEFDDGGEADLAVDVTENLVDGEAIEEGEEISFMNPDEESGDSVEPDPDIEGDVEVESEGEETIASDPEPEETAIAIEEKETTEDSDTGEPVAESPDGSSEDIEQEESGDTVEETVVYEGDGTVEESSPVDEAVTDESDNSAGDTVEKSDDFLVDEADESDNASNDAVEESSDRPTEGAVTDEGDTEAEGTIAPEETETAIEPEAIQTNDDRPAEENAIDPESEDDLSQEAIAKKIEFTSGTFTADESGQIGVEFVYDGGAYKGEVALFSLEGMEEFGDGNSIEFIKEAARRAASNSELGQVVISDGTEGAKILDSFENNNWNSGEYKGIKTVTLRSGDRFAFMLVPNGTVQKVLDNPEIGNAGRPLFSLATANPDDGLHLGQIADVKGDGSTFVWEDQRIDLGTDRDYNDLIFRVTGAKGEAISLDEVIDANKDWRQREKFQDLVRQILGDSDSEEESGEEAIDGKVGDNDSKQIDDTGSNTADDTVEKTEDLEIEDPDREPEITITSLGENSPVENVTLDSEKIVETIDLSEIFTTHDDRELQYEVVSDSEAIAVQLEADRLQIQSLNKPGLTPITVRATDAEGNSVVQIWTVETHGDRTIDRAAIEQINDVLNGLQQPSASDSKIGELERLIDDNPELVKAFGKPNELQLDEAAIETAHQLASNLNFAQQIGLTTSLEEALAESEPGVWDRFLIDSDDAIAQVSEDAPPTPVAFIDFTQGNHDRQVTDVFEAVNPNTDYETLQVSETNWAEQLVRFVNDNQEKGNDRAVVNLSFDLIQIDAEGQITTRYELTPEEQLAIEYARENNVLLVVASGNTGGQMSGLGIAAERFDNIITVGAVDRWAERADYSSIGNTLSLVAPGGQWEDDPNAFVGTSRAASYVTGAASLVWAANPGLNYQQVKKLLIETADDIADSGWDVSTGAGLLDVEAAVNKAKQTVGQKAIVSETPEIFSFTGEGQVKTAARPASGATEKAIEQLWKSQSHLVDRWEYLKASETPSLTLEALQAAVAEKTKQAIATFENLRTEVAISEYRERQQLEVLELANQHDRIEGDRWNNFAAVRQVVEGERSQLQENRSLLENQLASDASIFQIAIEQLEEQIKLLEQKRNSYRVVEYSPSYRQIYEWGAISSQLSQIQSDLIKYRKRTSQKTYWGFWDKLEYAAVAQQNNLKQYQQLLYSQSNRFARSDWDLSDDRTLVQFLRERANLQNKIAQKYEELKTEAEKWRAKKAGNQKWEEARTGRTHRNRYENEARKAQQEADKLESWADLVQRRINAITSIQSANSQIESHRQQIQSTQDKLQVLTTVRQQELAALSQQIEQADSGLALLNQLSLATGEAAKSTESRREDFRTQLDEIQSKLASDRAKLQQFLNTSGYFIPTRERIAIAEQLIEKLEVDRSTIALAMLQIATQVGGDLDIQEIQTNLQSYLQELDKELEWATAQRDLLAQTISDSPQRQAIATLVTKIQAYQTTFGDETLPAQQYLDFLNGMVVSGADVRADSASLDARFTTTKTERDRAGSTLEQLQQEAISLNSDLTKTEAAIPKTEEEIARTEGAIAATKAAIDRSQLTLESLGVEVTNLQSQIDGTQAEVARYQSNLNGYDREVERARQEAERPYLEEAKSLELQAEKLLQQADAYKNLSSTKHSSSHRIKAKNYENQARLLIDRKNNLNQLASQFGDDAAQTKRTELAPLYDRDREALATFDRELEALKALDGFQTQLSQLNGDRDELLLTLDKLTAQKPVLEQQANDIYPHIELVEAYFQEVKKESDRLENQINLLVRGDELEKEYQAQQNRWDDTIQNYTSATGELLDRRLQGAVDRARLAQLEAEVTEAKSQLETNNIEIQTAESTRQVLQEEIELIDLKLANQQAIRQQLESQYRSTQLTKKMAYVQSQQHRQQIWQSIGSRWQYNSQKAREANYYGEQASFLQDELNRLSAETQQANDRIRQLENTKAGKNDELNANNEKLDRLKQIELRDSIAEMEAEIATLAERLAPLLDEDKLAEEAVEKAAKTLEEMSSQTDGTMQQQVNALERVIDFGLLATESDVRFFGDRVEPKIKSFIEQIGSRNQQLEAQAEKLKQLVADRETELEQQLAKAKALREEVKTLEEQAQAAYDRSQKQGEIYHVFWTVSQYFRFGKRHSTLETDTYTDPDYVEYETLSERAKQLRQEADALEAQANNSDDRKILQDLLDRLNEQNGNLGNWQQSNDVAVKRLETKLDEAIASLENLHQKQELETRQNIERHEIEISELQAQLNAERAAEVAMESDTVLSYVELADRVRQDLQEVTQNWVADWQESHQIVKDLGDRQQQQSQSVDNLIAEIQNDLADSRGEYQRRQANLRDAITTLGVVAPLQDAYDFGGINPETEERIHSVTNTEQTVDRLTLRIQQYVELGQLLEPLAKRYEIDLELQAALVTLQKQNRAKSLLEQAAALERRLQYDLDNELDALGSRIEGTQKEAKKSNKKASKRPQNSARGQTFAAQADRLENEVESLESDRDELIQQKNSLPGVIQKLRQDAAEIFQEVIAATNNESSLAALQSELQTFDSLGGNWQKKLELVDRAGDVWQSWTVDRFGKDIELLPEFIFLEVDYEAELRAAKAKAGQFQAKANASSNQANWYAEQAEQHWRKSHKQGHIWYEGDIAHVDHHWLLWKQYSQMAKGLRQQGSDGLAEATKWNREVARLERLVEQQQAAREAAANANAAKEENRNLIEQLQVREAAIPEYEKQRDRLTDLAGDLQSLQSTARAEAEKSAQKLNPLWDDFSPAIEADRTALEDALKRREQVYLRATELQYQHAEAERAVERQSTALATELEGVKSLGAQLEAQYGTIVEEIAANDSPSLQTKRSQLEKTLKLLSEKEAVLVAQQAALAQKRQLLAAQNDVILAEKQLIDAYLQDPDDDWSNLEAYLNDTRQALKEAQRLAEEAEAASQVLARHLQAIQGDFKLQNDAHIASIAEHRTTLKSLIEQTELVTNYAREAAVSQREVNDLEEQIIDQLEIAAEAGNAEAQAILDAVKANNIATAAGINARDLQDLAEGEDWEYLWPSVNQLLLTRVKQRRKERDAQQQALSHQETRQAAEALIKDLESDIEGEKERLNELREKLADAQDDRAQLEQELAVAQVRVDELGRIRQQTEQTIFQLLALEQLNLKQAQLEQQIAQLRKDEIGEAVLLRLEREQQELERDRQTAIAKIELVKQLQVQNSWRDALNEVRDSLGESALAATEDPVQLETQLAGLLSSLEALQAEQPELPESVKVSLQGVEGDIHEALQGKEAATIQANLLGAIEGLMPEMTRYQDAIDALTADDDRDVELLTQLESDLGDNFEELQLQIERSGILQERRDLVEPEYWEAIDAIALAEQAQDISEGLAKRSKQAINQIIAKRIERREAEKKGLFSKLLGIVATIIGLIGAVLLLFPAAAAIGTLSVTQLGLSLSLVSGGIGAVQAAVNGDWLGAIFNGIMSAASFISGSLGQALKLAQNAAQKVWGMTQAAAQKVLHSIKAAQSLASGVFSGVRSALSGDGILSFLQVLGGVAGATVNGFGGSLIGSSVGEFGYKVLQSLSNAPAAIYSSIKAIENGDLVNGIGTIVKTVASLAKTWANDFNDGVDTTFEKIADIFENIGYSAVGVAKFVTGGFEGLLDGLGDILDGLGDNISTWLEKTFFSSCICVEVLSDVEVEEKSKEIVDRVLSEIEDLPPESRSAEKIERFAKALEGENPQVQGHVIGGLVSVNEQVKLLQSLPAEEQSAAFHELPQESKEAWVGGYFSQTFEEGVKQEDTESLQDLANLESQMKTEVGNVVNKYYPPGSEQNPLQGSVSTVGNPRGKIDKGLLSFVWGALQGEFNRDPSFGQVLLGMAIDSLPGLQQVTAVRDLGGYIVEFVNHPETMKNPWVWVGVVGAISGAIPVAGGVMKKALKAISKAGAKGDVVAELRKLGEPAIESLIKLVNSPNFDKLSKLASEYFSKTLDYIEGALRSSDNFFNFSPGHIVRSQGFLGDAADKIVHFKDVGSENISNTLGQLKKTVSEINPSRNKIAQASETVVHYTPVNPGPLDSEVAKTFRSATYDAIELPQPVTLYRVYGGDASQLGTYWSATKPQGSLQAILDSALLPEWGNTVTRVVKIEVPAGTTIYRGVAAPQKSLPGGGSQIVLDAKVEKSWIKDDWPI